MRQKRGVKIMEIDDYFLISMDSGDINIQKFSKIEMEEKLESGIFSETAFRGWNDYDDDPNDWSGNKYLLLKGSTVVPKIISKVIKWEI